MSDDIKLNKIKNSKLSQRQIDVLKTASSPYYSGAYIRQIAEVLHTRYNTVRAASKYL